MAPGRKRKPGKRYPCGKRTRQEPEKDAMSTVIEARRRHFGVTAKQAKDERLGTALGRLAFRELISETQYQAGVAFARALPAAPRGDGPAVAQPALGRRSADQRGDHRREPAASPCWRSSRS